MTEASLKQLPHLILAKVWNLIVLDLGDDLNTVPSNRPCCSDFALVWSDHIKQDKPHFEHAGESSKRVACMTLELHDWLVFILMIGTEVANCRTPYCRRSVLKHASRSRSRS